MALSDAANILVVRAVEETHPSLIDPVRILDAEIEAGSLEDRFRWFAVRASHIVRWLPSSYQALPEMSQLAMGRIRWILLGSAILGLATNYLGPSQSIHVVYNPIVLLILWNLGVYTALVYGALRPKRVVAVTTTQAEEPQDAVKPNTSEKRLTDAVSRRPPWLASRLFGRTVPAIWVRLNNIPGASKEEIRQALHLR